MFDLQNGFVIGIGGDEAVLHAADARCAELSFLCTDREEIFSRYSYNSESKFDRRNL